MIRLYFDDHFMIMHSHNRHAVGDIYKRMTDCLGNLTDLTFKVCAVSTKEEFLIFCKRAGVDLDWIVSLIEMDEWSGIPVYYYKIHTD